ncbi:uncharacterized protein LOC115995932 [Ipomoea triloba]|uniref:uncharacterized protein LOC115995932 n=1 Tax=Ipomoea triloba TaxID=35885 RepID=UPI00125E41DE|nr:uncharacterized protein LOC115995932 [Ipomoea triloba]
MALSYLTNWKFANEKVMGRMEEGVEMLKWKPPCLGRVKLNAYAAFDEGNNVMGLGWVLRDDDGRFLAAKRMCVLGKYEVKEAKAVCVREALSWMKGTSIGDVDAETDLQLVYYALCSDSFNSVFGFIIDDVKDVASMIDGVDFYFVKRSTNRASHTVAREVVSMSSCGQWFDDPPLYLVDCFLSDLTN